MWNSDTISEATGGERKGAAFEANGVVIDSRKIQSGILFVALKGDRVDGHDYVKDALAKGAVGALVSRIPEGLPPHTPLIVVPDTYKALVDMAVATRKRTTAKIIAVTGSVGKTGTKEALRTALASHGSVYATEGNLNNHIGLPLSLANLPEKAQFGVFELGMNHAGELSFLTRIVRPDIAIITNVEAVHLEFFANVQAIADAKAEIMEGMATDSTIVLNRDNHFYEHLHQKAQVQAIQNIITFGAHAEAQCRLMNYTLEELGSRVEATIHGMPITYHLGTIGQHWALTSLAVLAAGIAAGVDLADAAAALAHFHEPEGRGRVQRAQLPQGAVTLIDDCYNASPSSMTAGIAKLAELHQSLHGAHRKIAVLGDMLELGMSASQLHVALAEPLAKHHIDKVYASGTLMKHLYDSLAPGLQGGYAADSAALAATVVSQLQPGDIVLIKGSRGSRMDKVRDALLAAGVQPVKESADAL